MQLPCGWSAHSFLLDGCLLGLHHAFSLGFRVGLQVGVAGLVCFLAVDEVYVAHLGHLVVCVVLAGLLELAARVERVYHQLRLGAVASC